MGVVVGDIQMNRKGAPVTRGHGNGGFEYGPEIVCQELAGDAEWLMGCYRELC